MSNQLTITTSSEMMTNYLQAELIEPNGAFEALQTADGHSMLFGIGTNGAFNVIVEQSGSTPKSGATSRRAEP
jgi:hypothetical protein